MGQFKEPWEDAELEEARLDRKAHELGASPGRSPSEPPNEGPRAAAAAALRQALTQASADAAAGAAHYREAAVRARAAARAAALDEHQARVRAARKTLLRAAAADGSGDVTAPGGGGKASASEAEGAAAQAAAQAAAEAAAQAAADAEAAEARAAAEAQTAAEAAERAAAAEAEAQAEAEAAVKPARKSKSFMAALARPFGKSSGRKKANEAEWQRAFQSAALSAPLADTVGAGAAPVAVAAGDDGDLHDAQRGSDEGEEESGGSGEDEARRSFGSDGSGGSDTWSAPAGSAADGARAGGVGSAAESAAGRRRGEQQLRRVRLRCAAQQRATEQWWREAQARHDMRRLWMRLGPQQPLAATAAAAAANQHDRARVLIGSRGRFDRVFRPDKLTQFDKIFGYEFNLPVPLHANQEASSRSRGGFPGFPGGRRGPRRGGDGGDGGGGDGNDEAADAGFLPSADAAAPLPEGAGGLGGGPLRDGDAEDDEEGPDRAVTIGRLVRDLFPLSRLQPRPPGSSPPGPGEGPGSSSTTTTSRGAGLSAGLPPGRSSSSAAGAGRAELVVVQGADGRFGVGLSCAFVGSLGTTPRGPAAWQESRRFAAVSEFAQQPER
jgi:hypothetical protein